MSRLETDLRSSRTDLTSAHRAEFPEVIVWFISLHAHFCLTHFPSPHQLTQNCWYLPCHIISYISPHSLYLCHQFSLYMPGEDCHALICQFPLNIGGCKIEVRSEVEISAYSTGTGESFVGSFSMPPHIHRASSSLDEALASLPNSTPGSSPKSPILSAFAWLSNSALSAMTDSLALTNSSWSCWCPHNFPMQRNPWRSHNTTLP